MVYGYNSIQHSSIEQLSHFYELFNLNGFEVLKVQGILTLKQSVMYKPTIAYWMHSYCISQFNQIPPTFKTSKLYFT